MASRVALVAGIGQYKSPYPSYPSLQYCAPSAKEVFELLTSPEFGQCAPAPASKLLTDADGETITPGVLFDAVEQIVAPLKSDDLFLFYFSGHGDISGSNLFLMTPGSKVAQDGYSFSSLMNRLGERNALNTILVVDACFSRAMFNSIKAWGQGRMPDRMGLMASAGYMQRAWEDNALGRTLFSFYFCEGIRNGCAGYASAEKSVIMPDTMTQYINDQLRANHGEYAQEADLFQMGKMKQLWIAKRDPQAQTARPPKPIFSFAEIIKTFRKEYILPKESDKVLNYLNLIRWNLNIPPAKTHIKSSIEEQIDELIPRIADFRTEGREKSSQADQKKGKISESLQILHHDLERAKG
jgi:hypothetical protein